LHSAQIERAIEAMGFELVTMDRGGGRNRPLLRVRIDHSVGRAVADDGAGEGRERPPVTVEDCAAVMRTVRELLEESDDEGAADWVLEVSSPGVERPLVKARDFARFAGDRIRVRGYAALAGSAKQLEGTLLGLVSGEETFGLEIDGDRIEIPLDAVATARLVYEWGQSRSGA